MLTILFAIVTVLFWILLNMFFSVVFRQKFLACLPFSMIVASFIMYFGQLVFHSFWVGFCILIVVAIIGLVLFFFHRFENDRDYLKGIVIFLFVFFLYFIIDFHAKFHVFDEYYHWGTMVKESLRLDRFYSISENLWIHQDYPPFMCMIQLLWCKLNGGYSEMVVLHATHVFNMTLLITPFSLILNRNNNQKQSKSVLQTLLLFFLLLSVVLAFDPYKLTNSILVDITVPIAFMYGFFAMFLFVKQRSLFAALQMIFAQSALLFIKQVSISFVLILDLFYVLLLLHDKKIQNEGILNKGRIKNVVSTVFALLVPFIIYSTWLIYIKNLGVTGQFSLKLLSLKDYVAAFNNVGLQHSTLKQYFQALFTENITTISWLPLTYAASFCLIVLWIVLLKSFFPQFFNKRIARITFCVFTVGTVGYSFLMSVLYLFSFSETEMRELASFPRYMASYVLGEILILLLISCWAIVRKNSDFLSNKRIAILALISIIAFNPTNVYYMIPQYIRGASNYEFIEDSTYLRDRTDVGDKIFIIYDNDDRLNFTWYGAYNVCIQYQLNDRFINRNYPDLYNYPVKSIDDTIINELQKYDYIYIRNMNRDMLNYFNSFLIGEESIQLNQLYLIVHNNNSFQLIPTD